MLEEILTQPIIDSTDCLITKSMFVLRYQAQVSVAQILLVKSLNLTLTQ